MRQFLFVVLLVLFLHFSNYYIHVQGLNNLTYNSKDLAKIFLQPAFQRRVIGGDVTTNEKLGGYLVTLRYHGDFICGGTLVADRFVITAAHCFLGRPNKNKWIIEAGISDLDTEGPYTSELRDFIKPAAFREHDMNMDVAVVLLRKPLVGPGIGKLNLCNVQMTEGLILTVSGWGLVDPRHEHPQTLLRTVQVPVIRKKRCKRIYRQSVTLTNSMFCAGVLGEKDACTFDSGGPLAYKDQLCGIVSFGIGCASKKYPGVYTDINYVRPFIEKAMRALLS